MGSDRDLLITIHAKVQTIANSVEKINGNIVRHDKRLREQETTSAVHNTRLEDVEKRPSPLKWIIAFGSIQALVNGIGWWMIQ